MVIAGLNPFLEMRGLETRTPTNEHENYMKEKSPARLSFSPHFVMNIGRMGPISEITIPFATNPAQSRQKITLCEVGEAIARVCVFEDIMAFCRSRAFRAMICYLALGNGKQSKND